MLKLLDHKNIIDMQRIRLTKLSSIVFKPSVGLAGASMTRDRVRDFREKFKSVILGLVHTHLAIKGTLYLKHNRTLSIFIHTC